MTIYAVQVHHVTHTCPADGDPHPVDTRRTIVHTTPGGPCRTPVTIRCGDNTALVACGRRNPVERQCFNCRATITQHRVTTQHTDAQPIHVTPAPPGLAPHPCAVCRQPLAAVLADRGHHVLCHPHPRPSTAGSVA